MTLTLALFLIAQIAPEPMPSEEEIVVIGQRLSTLSVNVGHDAKGRYFCNLSESSGSASLDAKLCKTSATCVRKGASTPTEVTACINKRKSTLLTEFRRKWTHQP